MEVERGEVQGQARKALKATEAPLKERNPSPSVRPAPPGIDGGVKPADAKEKDIMKLLVQQNKKQTASNADSCAIVVGTASCGKSTILRSLLHPSNASQGDKEQEPKPTLALEYSYLRSEPSKSTESRKDGGRPGEPGALGAVQGAHIWEVGGGTAMQNLLDVPLTDQSVKNATLVIVADLSKPKEVWAGVTYWLERLRTRLQDIDKVLKSKEATAKMMEQLKDRGAKRFGEKHPDNVKDGDPTTCGRGMIKHTGIHIVIVATKYDVFVKRDPQLKKVMGLCLRFLAHTNGASLVYCEHARGPESDEARAKELPRKFRQLLLQLLFKGKPDVSQLKTLKQTDHLQPLFVPAGLDALKDIGILDKERWAEALKTGESPIDVWKGEFAKYFCENQQHPHLPTGPEALPDMDPEHKYAERGVDSALEKKELELKLYRDSQKKDQQEERRDARAGSSSKPVPTRKPSVPLKTND